MLDFCDRVRVRESSMGASVLQRYMEHLIPDQYASMLQGERIALTEDAGDILEAIGGICHAWAPQSRTFVCEKCVAWKCTRDDIDELRGSLNMCVRRVSEILAHSWGACGSEKCLPNAISIIDHHSVRSQWEDVEFSFAGKGDGRLAGSRYDCVSDSASFHSSDERDSSREGSHAARDVSQSPKCGRSASSWEKSGWMPGRPDALNERLQESADGNYVQSAKPAESSQELRGDVPCSSRYSVVGASARAYAPEDPSGCSRLDGEWYAASWVERWRDSSRHSVSDKWQRGVDASSSCEYNQRTGAAQERKRLWSASEWGRGLDVFKSR